MLVILFLLMYVHAIKYVCSPVEVLEKAALVSATSISTETFYPITVTGEDQFIPLTLAVNNYLFEDTEQATKDLQKQGMDTNLAPQLMYHEIDVKVSGSPFDDLYTVCPALYLGDDLYVTRVRDNLSNLFRVRYSTTKGLSCLGSNLIQFKLFFIHNEQIYEYYFGNCNSTQIFYDGFNSSSLCIPFNFTCYDNAFRNTRCTGATYDLAYKEMRSHNLTSLESSGVLSISGLFPTSSVLCLDGVSCTFSVYSTATYNPSMFSTNTPLVVESMHASSSTASDHTRPLTDTLCLSSSNAGHPIYNCIGLGIIPLLFL